MPVDGTLGEAGRSSDFIEPGGLVPSLQENSPRFREQALPGLLQVRVYRTGRNRE
jgi:hypothetical protein